MQTKNVSAPKERRRQVLDVPLDYDAHFGELPTLDYFGARIHCTYRNLIHRLRLRDEDGRLAVWYLYSARVGWIDADIDPELFYVEPLQRTGLVTEVRLTAYPVDECGCVKNLGGYFVRHCEEHAAEAAERNEEIGESRCDHGVQRKYRCGWCEVGAEQGAIEDRREIDRATGAPS